MIHYLRWDQVIRRTGSKGNKAAAAAAAAANTNTSSMSDTTTTTTTGATTSTGAISLTNSTQKASSELNKMKEVFLQHKLLLDRLDRILFIGETEDPYSPSLDPLDLFSFFTKKTLVSIYHYQP